jgi:hypothetical protein
MRRFGEENKLLLTLLFKLHCESTMHVGQEFGSVPVFWSL